MKFRSGFVSNSSSSSFLVEIRTLKFEPTGRTEIPKFARGKSSPYRKLGLEPPKILEMRQVSTPLLITKRQCKALQERGFEYCNHTYASTLEKEGGQRDIDPDLATHMRYHVICNESDEVEFLVRHRIPFEASTHYGHYNVFFRKGWKRVVTVRNPGLEIETYKDAIGDPRRVVAREPIIHEQTVKSILKEGWVK